MNDDIAFEIDTAGVDGIRSSRLFYNTNGNIELTSEETSKPSQERPSILKQKAKRYHENEKKFIPGKISYQLRKALGLGLSDVPEHIYRMRHLGYPPGWLKKAAVNTDNISITGASAVVNTSRDTKTKYDWEKLYEYPGFNTFKNYDRKYDHCKERGFFPMQDNCLIENFVKYLSREDLLGKEATNIKDIRSRDFINKDSDFNLPITPSSKPVANSTPIQSAKKINGGHTKSSFIDLSDGEVEDEDEETEAMVDSKADISGNASLTESSRTENGTYLLIPSLSKPTLDHFSEGINDHRLFENLPNVGGAYKKVLDVLKRIQA